MGVRTPESCSQVTGIGLESTDLFADVGVMGDIQEHARLRPVPAVAAVLGCGPVVRFAARHQDMDGATDDRADICYFERR